MVGRVYALSTAALSRRLRLATVCSKRLIVSASWVTCSVLVVAVWLLPLLDAGVPGVSFEKTFFCSHPSLCLSTWGVVCLALMYVVQCCMVRKLGPWLPTPFTDCVVTIVLWAWRCLRLSVCVCGNHMLVRAITHHPFELGSPNLDHRCKRPWLRSLLYWGVIDLDLQGQIQLQSQNLPHFELVGAITHHPLKLGSPNLNQNCKIPWSRSLFFWGLIELDLSNLTIFKNPVYLHHFCIFEIFVRPAKMYENGVCSTS